jgi:hypothetical protein
MRTHRWKEFLELLAAGADMIPLADNDAVYRRLEQRLESLRTGAKTPEQDESRRKAA